ncbi:MAG: phosphotransferase [Chloroflexota bacterium]
MHEEIEQLLVQNYPIPEIGCISSVNAGFLSHNFIVETGEQKYFFKQYRFAQIEPVKAAHEAKFFFANANVPVILPFKNNSSETILQKEGKFYALFPFINGHQYQRGHIPTQALESMAQMQGRIHLAGANAQLPYIRSSNSRKSYIEFVDTVHLILSKIPDKGRTEFDERAMEVLHLKLHLAEQNRHAIERIKMESDHLVHGDYQDGNIFFDQYKEVSHVFDWEQTKIAPRVLSVFRAIALICLQGQAYLPEHSEENFKKARHYLAAYNDIYPIRRGAFHQAATVRYLHKMVSLWVETAHYLDSNDRVDVFLESDRQILRYYAAHYDEYVERIGDGIL